MGQTLVKNYLHIVFSTRNRQPFITPHIAPELFKYIGGICKKLECFPLAIGGHIDHIHILCVLSKKIALIKLMQEIKTYSSLWIKERFPKLQDFYWQEGYGAFSVNHQHVEQVKSYIYNQHLLHSSKNFENEFRGFLEMNEVEYDERYVWG